MLKRRKPAATRWASRDDAKVASGVPGWTFLSNHAHVLIVLARDSELTLRAVAERVGITERAVQKIVAELEAGGYVTRERHESGDARRNHYRLHLSRPLRHPVESHHTVGELIKLAS